ncbi:MAG: flagellar hook-basal body complex protein [bacterium]
MVGSALYAAISGLKSQQIKLDVIANNIANLNTFGYKGSRVAFSSLLSQTLRAAGAPQAGRGGTNPMQVGVGVQLSAIDAIISQGSIQTTGSLTDLAINGEGFFIISNGSSIGYTRAGNFTLDANGALITSNGSKVQGWRLFTADGTTIDTSTPVSDITVNFGEKLPGRATTTVNYGRILTRHRTRLVPPSFRLRVRQASPLPQVLPYRSPTIPAPSARAPYSPARLQAI